jgi:hypothetical protein
MLCERGNAPARLQGRSGLCGCPDGQHTTPPSGGTAEVMFVSSATSMEREHAYGDSHDGGQCFLGGYLSLPGGFSFLGVRRIL